MRAWPRRHLRFRPRADPSGQRLRDLVLRAAAWRNARIRLARSTTLRTLRRAGIIPRLLLERRICPASYSGERNQANNDFNKVRASCRRTRARGAAAPSRPARRAPIPSPPAETVRRHPPHGHPKGGGKLSVRSITDVRATGMNRIPSSPIPRDRRAFRDGARSCPGPAAAILLLPAAAPPQAPTCSSMVRRSRLSSPLPPSAPKDRPQARSPPEPRPALRRRAKIGGPSPR